MLASPFLFIHLYDIAFIPVYLPVLHYCSLLFSSLTSHSVFKDIQSIEKFHDSIKKLREWKELYGLIKIR